MGIGAGYQILEIEALQARERRAFSGFLVLIDQTPFDSSPAESCSSDALVAKVVENPGAESPSRRRSRQSSANCCFITGEHLIFREQDASNCSDRRPQGRIGARLRDDQGADPDHNSRRSWRQIGKVRLIPAIIFIDADQIEMGGKPVLDALSRGLIDEAGGCNKPGWDRWRSRGFG